VDDKEEEAVEDDLGVVFVLPLLTFSEGEKFGE